jgi:uncharacterized protein (DUF58 family)
MIYPDIKELLALQGKAKHLTLHQRLNLAVSTTGERSSPLHGRGLEFEEVRDYVAGDDVRNIDWRVTARTGKPHLKLYKQDQQRDVVLIIDCNSAMRMGSTSTFKSVQAARLAALLGFAALHQHDRCGIVLFGDGKHAINVISPKPNKSPLWQGFNILAKPPEQFHTISVAEALLATTARIQAGSQLIIISDFLSLDKEALTPLQHMRRHADVLAIAIEDPLDHTLPDFGPIACHHHEDSYHLYSNMSQGRRRYQQEWQDTRDHLTAFQRAGLWRTMHVKTADEPFLALSHALSRRSHKAYG